MKRPVLLLLVVLCPLLVGGCWNGRLLVAAEEPWWTAQGGDSLLRWPLARASLAHGYFPRFLIIGAQEDPAARLRRELAGRHYTAAVVGPLLSLEPQSYAPSFAATRFLLVDDPQGAPAPPNARRLLFDRTASFRIAGFAAGLSVRDEAGGTVSPALASRIGALVSSQPSGTTDELAAFSAGVAQALDGGEPSIRKLSEPIDPNSVRSAIEGMRRDGVEIFLLFTGAADSWSLSFLKDDGGCAIVASWVASAIFPQQVFLSIEEDLAGGVARFLSRERDGEGTVSGPVRIVAGKARPIPSEIALQVVRR